MKASRICQVACALFMSASLSAAEIDTQLKPLAFDADIAWQQFALPNVTIRNFSESSSEVWQYVDIRLVRQISYNVARLLYKDMSVAPQLPEIEIILEDMKGVAYKEGDFNGAKIHISAQYLAKFAEGKSQQALYDELIGVLYHEIAHAYQFDDNNYKEIGPVIEGIADVVRMKAGYVDPGFRKPGGNFDSGYKTTAFFIHWLEATGYPHLLVDLNGQLDPNDDKQWSWQTFSEHSGIDLSLSWKAYQSQL
ncbi:basic secretory protein-like protein [Pseudoalteromonas rubra]|uniref:basic secretory protein-like protein n=1 Tax=Pseudoalteromonas rubra TaxID=43658 RepID=UPI002DBE4CED|nr:basic secretory protein-like protein [Pseudoalteromonas rubra]MEC4089086.1 basic secretory protein-like protein [Pseudoalteromonas rubra]